MTGVSDHGEPAVLGHVHRRDLNLATVRDDGLDRTLDVVRHQVDRPGIRVSLLTVVPHAAADVLPVLQEREVATELGSGRFVVQPKSRP